MILIEMYTSVVGLFYVRAVSRVRPTEIMKTACINSNRRAKWIKCELATYSAAGSEHSGKSLKGDFPLSG